MSKELNERRGKEAPICNRIEDIMEKRKIEIETL